MRIKKGDYVQVIAGKNVGERGKVLRVLPKKNKVVVEGINYIYKHLKKSQKNPQGGRIQKEAPLDVSNVMLYCVNSQAPTRVTYKFEKTESKDDKKKKDSDTPERVMKVRYSKKSTRPI